MTEMVQGGNADAFAAVLKEHAPNKLKILTLTSRIAVELHYCRRCGSRNVIFQLVTPQGPKRISTREIAKCEAEPEFVRKLGLPGRQR